MRHLLLAISFTVFQLSAVPVEAQESGAQFQQQIISELSGQGFAKIRISRTFLGRVRVFATAPGVTREIIYNPRTGEILRDYVDDGDDEGDRRLIARPTPRHSSAPTSSSSYDGSDDDGHDDRDHDSGGGGDDGGGDDGGDDD